LQFGNALQRDLCIPVSPHALQQAKQASLVTTPPKPYRHDTNFKAALNSASVSGFHAGMNVTAGLVIAGGFISLIGIRNPKSTK
jgi:hypothetical protein